MNKDGWCIEYEDGTTFDHEDGAWEDAPTFGVMRVLVWRWRVSIHGQPPRKYTRSMRGFSHYYFREEGMSFEFGVWASAEAATTPPGVPAGESYHWSPGGADHPIDAPRLPAWARDLCKRADGPPWPWERWA